MADASPANAPLDVRPARFKNFCADFVRSPVAVASLILIVTPAVRLFCRATGFPTGPV